jgi:hypothetical protein
MPVKYEVEVDIDFKLLRKQKRVLISLASDKRVRTSKSRVDALEGIINLIDHMQDAAVDSGAASEDTVFGSENI